MKFVLNVDCILRIQADLYCIESNCDQTGSSQPLYNNACWKPLKQWKSEWDQELLPAITLIFKMEEIGPIGIMDKTLGLIRRFSCHGPPGERDCHVVLVSRHFNMYKMPFYLGKTMLYLISFCVCVCVIFILFFCVQSSSVYSIPLEDRSRLGVSALEKIIKM